MEQLHGTVSAPMILCLFRIHRCLAQVVNTIVKPLYEWRPVLLWRDSWVIWSRRCTGRLVIVCTESSPQQRAVSHRLDSIASCLAYCLHDWLVLCWHAPSLSLYKPLQTRLHRQAFIPILLFSDSAIKVTHYSQIIIPMKRQHYEEKMKKQLHNKLDLSVIITVE